MLYLVVFNCKTLWAFLEWASAAHLMLYVLYICVNLCSIVICTEMNNKGITVPQILVCRSCLIDY